MAKKKTSLKNIAGGVGKSPIQAFGRADPTLVKGARLASYYSGGSSSTTAGEANTDLIFDPAKKVLEDEMKKKEASATMEKCLELGGEWDYVNSKCSKDGDGTSTKGDKGDQGPQGAENKGQKGEPVATGTIAKGAVGEQGPQHGTKGEKGEVGPQGAENKGQKGEPGATGTNAKGQKGATGAAGSKGVKGAKADNDDKTLKY